MVKHMQKIEKNYNNIIPIELRDRYCLLFGNNVMEHYETEEEALLSLKKSCLVMVLVFPTVEKKIH